MSGYEFPCPECGETLAPFSKSCACGWRAAVKPKPAVNTNCACGRFGLIKRDGLWLCGVCSGVPPRAVGGHVGWRERWYQDRGLPYESAKLGDQPPFRCVGRAARTVERVMREPGQDDEEREVA